MYTNNYNTRYNKSAKEFIGERSQKNFSHVIVMNTY